LPIQTPVSTGEGAARVVYPPDPRRWVRVVRYLDGTLRRESPWQDGLAARIGTLAGRLDRALHAFTHAGCDQTLLWDLRRAPDVASLLPVLADDALAAVVRATLERFATHAEMLKRHFDDQMPPDSGGASGSSGGSGGPRRRSGRSGGAM
jgi:Ser/Thr protein kinase RdoA (MazF antagonist)